MNYYYIPFEKRYYELLLCEGIFYSSILLKITELVIKKTQFHILHGMTIFSVSSSIIMRVFMNSLQSYKPLVVCTTRKLCSYLYALFIKGRVKGIQHNIIDSYNDINLLL